MARQISIPALGQTPKSTTISPKSDIWNVANKPSLTFANCNQDDERAGIQAAAIGATFSFRRDVESNIVDPNFGAMADVPYVCTEA